MQTQEHKSQEHNKIKDVKDSLDRTAQQVKQQLEPAEKWARDTVKKQPLAITGGALGAGVVLGFGAGLLVGALALRSK